MTALDRTFSLVDDPWIPCRERSGDVAERGILQTLTMSDRLSGISGDVPTQVFALTRLLLAVLHGALGGPCDLDEWQELWDAEQLPVERIAPYLQRHRERFDLFHPATPFLQVAGLRTAKGETSELVRLVADVPNGIPFFTTRRYGRTGRWRSRRPRGGWCTARLRPVGHQVRRGGRRAGQGRQGLPDRGRLERVARWGACSRADAQGDLLLNLIARDFVDYGRDPQVDRPVWEREPLDCRRGGCGRSCADRPGRSVCLAEPTDPAASPRAGG